MSPIARTLSRLWVLAPVCACGFIVWTDLGRARRVDYVSGLEGRARPADVLDAGSATGYSGDQRELIVPGRNEDSFDWIAETQQMFARGEWRVHHVDTEDAPQGRDVSAPSPYRWWLGLVAWVDRAITGKPIGYCVERAALFSDPALQILFLAGMTALAAWRLGALAAVVLSLGLAAFFPFASGFLPGMPDQRGLSACLVVASVLTPLIGVRRPEAPGARGWFAMAGILGGLGLWISVPTQAPIMAGLFVGALLSGLVLRGGQSQGLGPLWRTWGTSAGLTVFVAFLAEYFPSGMASWRVDTVHPAYGLALLGAGEILGIAEPWIQGKRPSWGAGTLLRVALAVAALGLVPLIMAETGNPGFLARDLLWARLTRLPDGAVRAGTVDWLHGATAGDAWATLLPLAAVIPALVLVFRRSLAPAPRASLVVALGPVAAAGALAAGRLGWWSAFDGAALVLLAVAVADGSGWRDGARLSLSALVLAAAAAGAMRLVPPAPGAALTPSEGGELVERHLAHWLSTRSGNTRAVVYAPPTETVGLWFYGNLRGVGSFSPDNEKGFGAALNIAAATNMEDVQNDLRALGVRFVVVPSWDPFFDDFARLYLDKRFAGRPSLFAGELRRMNLPPWLRPVPYQMPVGGGSQGQSVLVFEVVDEQAPAAAAGRLAEYLVETGDLERAAAAGEALRRFPGDVGALAAMAQVQGARGDAEGASRTLEALVGRLSRGGDRYLPWDRRVSLAIVLAQGGKLDLARAQVSRCMADASEERLRSLSTGSLYALLVLGRTFGAEMRDPALGDLALQLLPADVRSRL
jgi:hypothetical protein